MNFIFRALLVASWLTLYRAAPVFASGLTESANRMVSDVYSFLVSASTAAAGIGVGVGVFMQKLSMGKQDKIEMGQRLVKNSVIGWGILNGIGLILGFVGGYL